MKNLALLICLSVALFAGCAGKPYLIVDYQLPQASDRLAGQTVRLEVKDARADSTIFTPAAADDFSGFHNWYSLAWLSPTDGRILAGEYDLADLFRVVMKKRLELLGVATTNDPLSKAPLLEVDLKELKIDLKDHKWLAKVSYTANLGRDSSLVAHENISGEAERVKIIGREGADTVFSDIFSDIINRLDLVKLFQQAKLTNV